MHTDRFVVPITFLAALLVALASALSLKERPPSQLTMYITMGPPLRQIGPGHAVGLRFTPHNAFSGHTLHAMVADEQPCVGVTVTNTSLTYLDQQPACRLKDGSYKLPYTFPAYDNYLVYITMQPVDGLTDTERIPVPLCAPANPMFCQAARTLLRGTEDVHTVPIRGLNMNVLLAAPQRAVGAGQPVQVSLLFLRHGHIIPDVEPGDPPDAVAISLDTLHIVHLRADPGQIAHGYLSGGALSFTGQFDTPSIYRVFTTARYHRQPVHANFTIDVNPAPTPAPASG